MMLPGYQTNSGDPKWDNWSRRQNKVLHRMARGLRYSGPGGWKRKKYVHKVERATYVKLIHEVSMDLLKKDRGRSRA